MTATLKLYADLARYAPENAGAYPLAPGKTLAGIMRDLGLPGDRRISLVVNGAAAGPEYEPKDGDRIAFVPPVSGG